MSTFAGTKAFADKITREVKEIDFVCVNVGAISAEFKTGEEGWEVMIELSLATTLLALLLLPWMKQAGKENTHLGIVTSMYLHCRSVTHIAQFCCHEVSIPGPSGITSQFPMQYPQYSSLMRPYNRSSMRDHLPQEKGK